MQRRFKFLIGFLIILGALVYLASGTFQSSLQYYVTASELLADPTRYQNKTLKVAGTAHSIRQESGGQGLLYHFEIHENGKIVSTTYQGFVPDTFKEGAEVVATGSLRADGHFVATEILAKCASKYEEKIKS